METNPKHEERRLQTIQTLIARCLLRCCCACIERARDKTRTRHGRRNTITTRAQSQEPRVKDEFRECAACKPKGCCEIDRDVLEVEHAKRGYERGTERQGRVKGQKRKEDERLREIWCLLWLCFVRGEHIVLAIRTVCDEEVRQELGRELEALYVEQVEFFCKNRTSIKGTKK